MREESLPVQVIIMIGRFIRFMIRFRLVDRRYKDPVDLPECGGLAAGSQVQFHSEGQREIHTRQAYRCRFGGGSLWRVWDEREGVHSVLVQQVGQVRFRAAIKTRLTGRSSPTGSSSATPARTL